MNTYALGIVKNVASKSLMTASAGALTGYILPSLGLAAGAGAGLISGPVLILTTILTGKLVEKSPLRGTAKLLADIAALTFSFIAAVYAGLKVATIVFGATVGFKGAILVVIAGLALNLLVAKISNWRSRSTTTDEDTSYYRAAADGARSYPGTPSSALLPLPPASRSSNAPQAAASAAGAAAQGKAPIQIQAEQLDAELKQLEAELPKLEEAHLAALARMQQDDSQANGDAFDAAVQAVISNKERYRKALEALDDVLLEWNSQPLSLDPRAAVSAATAGMPAPYQPTIEELEADLRNIQETAGELEERCQLWQARFDEAPTADNEHQLSLTLQLMAINRNLQREVRMNLETARRNR